MAFTSNPRISAPPTNRRRISVDRLTRTVVAALEEIKAQEIVVLNVTKLTSLFDRMVIASAQSNRQVKALADNVQGKVKAIGGEIVGVEGEQAAEWILVDLGDVVVHVMQPAVREYYNLEELWSATPRRKPAR